jgi:hypothetical protein
LIIKGGSHYGDGIVVKDGGNVFRREFVRCVADQEARLAYSTVADDDTPREARLAQAHELKSTGGEDPISV